jgi:hypothetical protein
MKQRKGKKQENCKNEIWKGRMKYAVEERI